MNKKAIHLKVGDLLLSTNATRLDLVYLGESERPWGYITKIAAFSSGNVITVIWTHDVANPMHWYEFDLRYALSNGSIVLYE